MEQSGPMKAYIVTDRNCDSGTSLVVFAQTHGKAKAYAARSEELCDYGGYTEMRASRCEALDGFYRGKPVMDWLDTEDRIAMVRYAGFACSNEVDKPLCEVCEAAQWCERANCIIN